LRGSKALIPSGAAEIGVDRIKGGDGILGGTVAGFLVFGGYVLGL